MTQEERREALALYNSAYELLTAALAEMPREMWQYRPAPGKWSVHEVVVHITDSEANSFIRCRRIIAEPGANVIAYDENAWAVGLDYHNQSTDDALELFRLLRAASARLIADLPDHVWEQTTMHPEIGVMTLDDWLRMYADHIPVHIAQMRRNLNSYELRIANEER